MDGSLKNNFKAERRLHCERRKFNYSDHIPERRSGKERRELPDLESLNMDDCLLIIEALQAEYKPVNPTAMAEIAHRRL